MDCACNECSQFGSWKVLEAKRVVICIGLWGLKDLCLVVCSVFGGCFSEVLLRYERLPFASQLGWLGLMRHDARHRSTTVASEFTQPRVTSCGLAFPSGAARQCVGSAERRRNAYALVMMRMC